MNKCIFLWMDENGWINKWMKNRWMNKCMKKWRNECMKKWMHEWNLLTGKCKNVLSTKYKWTDCNGFDKIVTQTCSKCYWIKKQIKPGLLFHSQNWCCKDGWFYSHLSGLDCLFVQIRLDKIQQSLLNPIFTYALMKV